MTSKQKTILPLEIQRKIKDIKSDSQSGATALTQQGIQIVYLLLQKNQSSNQQTLQQQIKLTLQKLLNAQPLMASLVTYANTILLSLEKQQFQSVQSLKQLVLKQSNTFLTDFSQANQQINTSVLPLLTDHTTVFTYSNSSTVSEALLFAHNKGRKINVHCSESRPTQEGTQLAKTLSKQGINTRISTDATLFTRLPSADLVLIGADSISTQGIYHKMGTHPLALLARIHHIPLYCLTAEQKIVPASYQHPTEPVKNPKEILSCSNEHLCISNYYFDCTPLSLFTAIITQHGLKKPTDILNHQHKLPLHESLPSNNTH